VGNGDPSCHEPDTYVAVASSRTIPVDGWRVKKAASTNSETAPENGVAFDDSSWDPVDVRADVGILGLRERAFYRTRLKLEAKDLDAAAVELVFSRIAGGVGVYVNGHRISKGVDGRSAAIFDVKSVLHAGENVIAVPTENYGPEGAGLSKGVTLRLQDDPPAVHWSRSVFNGLAEVIVQSTKEPGALKLKASSEGLRPASFQLVSQAEVPRPALP